MKQVGKMGETFIPYKEIILLHKTRTLFLEYLWGFM